MKMNINGKNLEHILWVSDVYDKAPIVVANNVNNADSSKINSKLGSKYVIVLYDKKCNMHNNPINDYIVSRNYHWVHGCGGKDSNDDCSYLVYRKMSAKRMNELRELERKGE